MRGGSKYCKKPNLTDLEAVPCPQVSTPLDLTSSVSEYPSPHRHDPFSKILQSIVRAVHADHGTAQGSGFHQGVLGRPGSLTQTPLPLVEDDGGRGGDVRQPSLAV